VADKPKYQLFIGHDWVIPAAADFTGIPEATIQKAWDKAQKQGKLCVLTVPGDIPAHKKCPVCSVNVRQETMVCPTDKCAYSWED
jgi:hypothetical protein